ncbi:MAG: hypothetical protein KDB03_10870 [Planctomycetales bacterium]|nr:hypothetical protein [Planctomycetales bacterium]
MERSRTLTKFLMVVPIVAFYCGSMAGLCCGQSRSPVDMLPSPHDIKYVGLSKCAACHFNQYKDWKDSEHNRAFEILPLKYRSDASCLKCHTTGKEGEAHAQEYGVSCEACHGPGEEHAKYALTFVNENRMLSETELTTLRGKIQRLDLHQCVNCHISKAHQKHPPFDRETPPVASSSKSMSFFQGIHEQEVVPNAAVSQPPKSETLILGTGR